MRDELRKKRVIVMTSVLEHTGVMNAFKFVEENLPNAKNLNHEVFESIMALVFFEAGFLKHRTLMDRRIGQIATRAAPYPSIALTEDDVDSIVHETIEVLTESCVRLDKHLSRKITHMLEQLDECDEPYDTIDIFYGTPTKSSLTIILGDDR